MSRGKPVTQIKGDPEQAIRQAQSHVICLERELEAVTGKSEAARAVLLDSISALNSARAAESDTVESHNERFHFMERASAAVASDRQRLGDLIAAIQAVHNTKPSETLNMGKTNASLIFTSLMRSYDTDGDGYISRDEFTDYYREISPAVADAQFAAMMKAAWKL